MIQRNSLEQRNIALHQPASNDLFSFLLEFKDYAIISIDTAGYIRSWNMGAEHIYGFAADEVLARHFSTLYPEEEIQNEQPSKHLEAAIKNGRKEHEGWRLRKDKTPFFANIILTAFKNEDGSIKGFANVTRDITIQKKLEEENRILTTQLEEKVEQRTRELATVNKELEAFSYSVSHDLRAPLRAISGYSIMLKEDYESKLDDEARRIIDVIVNNTRMMSELIDDLLTFSKMARLEIVNEAVDMNTIVRKCMTELLTMKQENKPTITVHNLPQCKGDYSMLKQVWFNLVSNAIKYSSKTPDAKVSIGTVDDSSSTIYYIKDNGTGFDMKYSNKLFGVFQRLHRQDEFEGTGLGLALAKRIVTKHGGEIWAEAAVNEGATFYFSIPKN